MKSALIALILTVSLYTQAISIKLVPETGNPPSSRQLFGFTLDSFDQKLYIYGGISTGNNSDIWEFDLLTNRWSEIHSVSVQTPGSLSSPFLTRLKGQRKILLFGGDTPNGPTSDVWLYEIDYQTVILI